MKNVTIVIPAYNEIRFIEKAILSAVSQAEFVIVSDNCSTDGTQEICKKLTKEFSNLIFYTQEKNIGGVKNAEFLYKQVQTDYVMTMGAHDILAENYVDELKKTLDENPDAVMSFSPSICIDDNDKILREEIHDDFAKGFSNENVLERIYTAVVMEYNYAIFGLFKTEVFLKNTNFIKEAGIDHLIMAKCAKDGKFIRSLNTRFYLRIPTREETEEAYMERLAGVGTKIDMSYSCVQQLNVLDSIDHNIQKEKDFIFNNAKSYLQKKYSKSCKGYIQFILNKITKLNSNYILYGAGTDAQRIIPILKDKILFIVDQDINKQGNEIESLKIYSIEKTKEYKDTQIIISQIGRFDTISSELVTKYGISLSKLVSLDVDKVVDYE